MPIDYSPLFGQVPESGASRGMSFLSNALDAVLQRRAAMQAEKQQREQAEAHFQANLGFQRDQAQMQEAARLRDDQRADAAAQALQGHQRAEMERQNREQRGKVIKDVGGMFATPGQESAGLAYLQSQGIKVAPKQIDPALTQPIPQPEPQSPLPFLPMPDVDGMRATAQEQDRQRQVDATKGVYSLDFGDGATQDLDVRAMGPEGQAERIQRILPMLADPVAAAAARRQALLAGAGMTKPDEGGKFVEGAVGRSEDNAAAMERARVSAAASRERRNDLPKGEQGRLMNAELNNYLSANSYRQNKEEASQFAKMASLAKAADGAGGAEAAQMFMGLYTKYAQGQVGVLTQSDIDTFWTKAGSPKDRSEAALTKLLTGQEGPEKRARAMQAISALASSAKSKLAETEKGAGVLMEPYGDEGDRALRAYFGRGLPAKEKARAEADVDALLGSGSGKKRGAK